MFAEVKNEIRFNLQVFSLEHSDEVLYNLRKN